MNEIVTKTITDTSSHNEKIHKVININAVVPCPRTCLFYDNVGAVNPDTLKSILGSKTTNVVGWYLYEPENNFKLTLRSKVIHKELCSMFSISSDLFCCCLLSATKSSRESTFSYTHTFIRFRNRQFLTVPMHIANLGETANSYKPKVHASKSFIKLCQSLKKPTDTGADWQSIEAIQDKLHSEIIKTMRQLSHSEHAKAEIEREVEQLRQQVVFQKSILEDKAAAEAEKANAQNDAKTNDHPENNVNLMDLDINKLNELTAEEPLTTNLNADLSTTNANGSRINVKEKTILKGVDLNTSGVTVDETNSKKVISDRNEKTDEQENILVDTDSPSTSSEVHSSYFEKNLIDLTVTEEKERVINSQNGPDETAINVKKCS